MSPAPVRRPGPRVGRRTALAAATALVAAGCATTAPASEGGAGSPRVVRVVAAENSWGSLAAQLGGTHARVTSVIDNPAADPHDYEPTAADARTVAGAQLVVTNGVGYDAWADRLLAVDPGTRRTVLRVGDLVGVRPGGNPHRWYSPTDVHRVIAAVSDALRRIDPADADYFAARRTALETTGFADYDRLVHRIRTRYAGTPIGASESVVTPLADGLGLRTLTPDGFLRAISEGSDPTARDKAAADRQIRDRRIAVYVYNGQNATPDVRRQVERARAAGTPVVTLTETLTPSGASFQQWQVRQLTALEAALAEAAGERSERR